MSNWLNLGHDSQRTSTDPDGNITSVAEVWIRKTAGNPLNGWAGGAIADSDSLYYFYSTYFPTIGGTGDRFSMAKYSKDGVLLWNNTSLGGHNTGNYWPAKIGDFVYFHDYRGGVVNIFTGAREGILSNDSYGFIAVPPSEDRWFTARTGANEGFVGGIKMMAVELHMTSLLTAGRIWVRNEADTSGGDNVTDYCGAVLYDNDKVYHAAKYSVFSAAGGWNYPSGIYAWDYDGDTQWSVVCDPLGHMSAGDNRLYLAEGPIYTTNSVLKARSQTDGSVIWSQTISGYYLTGQPPVVVGTLVIVASSTGVHAFDSATGAVAWTAAISGINPVDLNKQRNTGLAAAEVSNTLVVTCTAGIVILDLTDGSVVQTYDPPSLEGRPVNPIIVGNRLYVTDLIDDLGFAYFPQNLLCLENVGAPPPADVTAPTVPGNPTFSSVTTTSITVSWTAATDAVGVAHYNLYYRQATGTWTSLSKTGLSHVFTGLSSGTSYEFYVNAADAAGNVSTNSATTSQSTTAVVADVTPPGAPGDPTFSNITTSTILVSWAAAVDDVAVASYTLYWKPVGGSLTSASVTTTSYNVTGLLGGSMYEFYVTATDTSGNGSAASNTTTQATAAADVTPPTTPGNPTFSSVTATSMTISWTASTDSGGVSYYRLFYRQSDGGWTTIHKTTTSHSLTNLTQNTTYEFYVNTTDISGNVSADSAITSQATSAAPIFTQLSGTISITGATKQKTTHNLLWENISGATMALQSKIPGGAYATIYTGDSPYSYVQTDLKKTYTYRVLINGTTPSNEIALRSARK